MKTFCEILINELEGEDLELKIVQRSDSDSSSTSYVCPVWWLIYINHCNAIPYHENGWYLLNSLIDLGISSWAFFYSSVLQITFPVSSCSNS